MHCTPTHPGTWAGARSGEEADDDDSFGGSCSYIEAMEDLDNDSGQWKDPGSSH
jgi:hypothetical protein